MRTEGTTVEAASLVPEAGNAESHGPPLIVETRVVNGICPRPVLRMLRNCGGGRPPLATA